MDEVCGFSDHSAIYPPPPLLQYTHTEKMRAEQWSNTQEDTLDSAATHTDLSLCARSSVWTLRSSSSSSSSSYERVFSVFVTHRLRLFSDAAAETHPELCHAPSAETSSVWRSSLLSLPVCFALLCSRSRPQASAGSWFQRLNTRMWGWILLKHR